jgi:hypothetical protein
MMRLSHGSENILVDEKEKGIVISDPAFLEAGLYRRVQNNQNSYDITANIIICKESESVTDHILYVSLNNIDILTREQICGAWKYIGKAVSLKIFNY